MSKFYYVLSEAISRKRKVNALVALKDGGPLPYRLRSNAEVERVSDEYAVLKLTNGSYRSVRFENILSIDLV